MDQSVMGEPVPDDAERDAAARLARARLLEQASALATRVPGHRLSVETWPGRGDRFVAQAITPAARPYLVVTDDFAELSAELSCPAAAGASPAAAAGISPPAAGTRPPVAPGAGDAKS